VANGSQLTILNDTSPRRIGPHSFSLVERNALPRGRDEIRKCRNFKLVCEDIAEAHQIQFPGPTIGDTDVDNGLDGWDLSFDGAGGHGDTWLSLAKGETEARTVTTTTDDRLFFLCLVHPDMKGKIDVLHPR
jgi:hypothetical protein